MMLPRVVEQTATIIISVILLLSTSGNTAMKVLGTTKFGRKHLAFLSDRPKPTPQSSTDVLIKVEYSDLNPVDHHKVCYHMARVNFNTYLSSYTISSVCE